MSKEIEKILKEFHCNGGWCGEKGCLPKEGDFSIAVRHIRQYYKDLVMKELKSCRTYSYSPGGFINLDVVEIKDFTERLNKALEGK